MLLRHPLQQSTDRNLTLYPLHVSKPGVCIIGIRHLAYFEGAIEAFTFDISPSASISVSL
jgi:hypothetical protein